jgi:hypothetical protein
MKHRMRGVWKDAELLLDSYTLNNKVAIIIHGLLSLFLVIKKENYAGSVKSLPTLIREKEPLWY